MSMVKITAVVALLAAGATGTVDRAAPPAGEREDAAALLDEGLRHMGGRERLEAIRTVYFDMMTQWQRTSWVEVPYPDRPSYEHHTDVRDYSIPAWRNTREFGFGADTRRAVDVVRDSVATRDLGRGPRPLSVAYVDERRELFATTPDRLLLWARSAPDLRAAGDTTIAGVAHARVTATVNGIPMKIYLRRADGLPAVATFRQSHVNDFGLVPWGDMDVEVWYSGWKTFPEGVSIPTQWDVRRVGVPYKRLTVLSATFNPVFAGDSFAVTPEQRAAYLASPAVRPMHDLPLDSARVLEGFLVDFHAFGSPAGALRMGDQWLLLDAGQAPLSARRALDWLRRATGAEAGAAVVGWSQGHGGVPELVARGMRTVVAPGVRTFVDKTLEGYGRGGAPVEHVTDARWLGVGSDSVWVTPFDLPDLTGALVLWSPTHRWLYAPDAATALDQALVMEYADDQGWPVERFGAARRLLQPRP